MKTYFMKWISLNGCHVEPKVILPAYDSLACLNNADAMIIHNNT